MAQLSPQTYSVLKEVFQIMGVDEAGQKLHTEEFERLVLAKFAAAVTIKLPEDKRQQIVQLANAAITDGQKQELQSKLKEWLSPNEIETLFKKTADQVFAELLQVMHQDATEEQKKKLEASFKLEALRG